METAGPRDSVRSPRSLTNALIAAWKRWDAEALAATIHPEAEIATPMAPHVDRARGRENAVALLLEMRGSFFAIDVQRVEEVSATEAEVFARVRTPLPSGGFSDGQLHVHIE